MATDSSIHSYTFLTRLQEKVERGLRKKNILFLFFCKLVKYSENFPKDNQIVLGKVKNENLKHYSELTLCMKNEKTCIQVANRRGEEN